MNDSSPAIFLSSTLVDGDLSAKAGLCQDAPELAGNPRFDAILERMGLAKPGK
jgi:hypothetical protein